MDYDFCKKVRLLELENIIGLFNKNTKVLEIGAGAGWQAQYISKYCCTVDAIDIQENRYSEESVWPITIYNGKNIPFEDGTFDIVFSSNVLEHISTLEEFQSEIRRVLKQGGVAIHILPTSAWRTWTSISHHASLIKQLLTKIFQPRSNTSGKLQAINNKSFLTIIQKSLWPERHGERGNSVTEIYYFNKGWWKKHFQKAGWEVVSVNSNNLFYTGNTLLADKLNINLRKQLSTYLGSATAIYIVK